MWPPWVGERPELAGRPHRAAPTEQSYFDAVLISTPGFPDVALDAEIDQLLEGKVPPLLLAGLPDEVRVDPVDA